MTDTKKVLPKLMTGNEACAEGALAAGMHAAHLSDGIVALIEDRYHPIDDLSDVLALLDRL